MVPVNLSPFLKSHTDEGMDECLGRKKEESQEESCLVRKGIKTVIHPQMKFVSNSRFLSYFFYFVENVIE